MNHIVKNPLFIFAVLIIFLANSSSHPTSNGGFTGAPGDGVCASCHSGSNPNFAGEIQIDGLPATITPGQAYSLTVTVTNTGSTDANRAGFQITALNASNAKAGNFTNAGSNSSIKNSGGKQYFGHSPAVQFNGGGSVTWDVTWTAPTSGTGIITFYGGAILGNGSGSSGDKFLVNQFQTTFGSSPLSVGITDVENLSCFGANDGSATASPSGGNTPYQYNWSSGQTTATATGLSAGLKTVTVTDNSGITATASVTITQPAELQMSSNNTSNPTCFNSFNGSISITTSGGTSPYFYDWSTGASSASINNLGPGTYTVTVTDQNDCAFIENFTLTAPPAIQINNAVVNNVNCFGNNNGSIQLTVSGGAGTLDFDWSNGATTQNLNNVPAGNYTVTITDDNSCALDDNFSITQPPVLSTSITVNSQVICNGGNTGSLTANAAGGTSPYNFSWNNSQTTPTINNLSSGLYSVTISDNNGCSSVKSQQLNNPAILASSVTSTTNASCPGVNNGAASITISGGVSPYTTAWSSGAAGTSPNNLPAGSNTYVVTDNLGCTTSGTVNIGTNQAAELAVDQTTPLLCFGGNNASISITATNAAGYSILWSTGASGTTISNLPAGQYSVQASNPNGCVSNLLSVQITSPDAILLLDEDVEDISCYNANDGSINAVYEGGTGQLQYLWNTGNTTSLIENLGPGTYNVVVTDANNCSASKAYILTQPAAILVDSVWTQNLNCFNENNGSLTVFASGGAGSLQAVWSNGDIGNTADTLALGNYYVAITDNDNCTITDTFAITAPPAIVVNGTIVNESATNMNDGSITVDLTNGVPPYSYFWSTGDTTNVIDSLAPGVYEVIVSDSTGCTQTAQFNVQSGNCALTASYEVTDVSCFGGNDGKVIITPGNGTAPYTITPLPEGLAAGTYSFIITDTSNCSITVPNVVVNQPLALSIKLDTIIAASGQSKADGEIRITVIGGTKPYNFEWQDSVGNVVGNEEDLSEVLPGTYEVVLVDQNNCAADTLTFTVDFTSSNDEVLTNSNVKIYPNPAQNRIYIDSEKEGFDVYIYDYSSKLLSVKTTNSNHINIDVTQYLPGLYMIKTVHKGNTTTAKIIIE